MPFETKLSSVLKSQKTAHGFWLTIPSAALARSVLRSIPGFSWVLLDAEHGLVTDKDYYELVNAVASENASPIIRVPWSEEWMIKKALDAGAHGIVTPMCHTEDDAKKIVKFSKYPPIGSRGYGPMFTHHAFPNLMKGHQYDNGANESLLVIIQIESKSGVENVEKIAQVNGVDVLFIGPFDLAKSMKVIHGSPEHEDAIQSILKAAQSAGKKAAIFCTSGVDARVRIAQGFDMVSITTDETALIKGVFEEFETAMGSE